MIMLCVFYCIPLLKFLYYASSGILLVFALFMLKRGIYSQRPRLRQAAFFMMFFIAFKSLMVDMRLERKYLLCHKKILPFLKCNGTGSMVMDLLGLVLFVLASVGILYVYRLYMPERKREQMTPEQIHLRLWANCAMWSVIVMICWLAAPWVGFLTVGYVPRLFTGIPWQYFGVGNLVLIVYVFWRSESCAWTYKDKKKAKKKYTHETWNPRDTLWTAVFMYLIALGLSYVSSDVLGKAG